MNENLNLVISNAPHSSMRANSTQRIMLDVIIALIPACVASILIFGHLVAINLALCILFCVGSEMLYNLIYTKRWNLEGLKDNSVWDLSSIVTGIILALNLPTHITVFSIENVVNSSGVIMFSFDTVFACLFGSIFAIMLVKMLFGGIGKNFVNPAGGARIFLMLCFSLTFVDVVNNFGASKLVTGATPLNPPNGVEFSLLNMFLGFVGSSAVGETSKIALILGYIYLSIKKVIDYKLPLMVVGSCVLFAFLFKGIPNLISGDSPKELIEFLTYQILSGGIIFGAIFMATDYSTNPNTLLGMIVFALGIGLFTMIIRIFGAFSEGFIFALIIMNFFVPLIDKYILRKPFGYKNIGGKRNGSNSKSI